MSVLLNIPPESEILKLNTVKINDSHTNPKRSAQVTRVEKTAIVSTTHILVPL